MIDDEANTLCFSVVSFFEVVLKARSSARSSASSRGEHRESWLGAGYREIGMTGEHVIAVARLPMLHKDPFDRLLVAQAEVEGAALLTADRALARYAGPVRFVG